MSRYSASTIATARFLHANPGATRAQILAHLGSVLDMSHRPWMDVHWQNGKVTNPGPARTLEGAFNHIVSPYYSRHLGGENCNPWGYAPSWTRCKCPSKGIYIYFLTEHGKRLLDMTPSKSGYHFKG